VTLVTSQWLIEAEMRTSRGFASVVGMILKVLNTIRLKARPVSACLWGSIFPIRENKCVVILKFQGLFVCAGDSFWEIARPIN